MRMLSFWQACDSHGLTLSNQANMREDEVSLFSAALMKTIPESAGFCASTQKFERQVYIFEMGPNFEIDGHEISCTEIQSGHTRPA